MATALMAIARKVIVLDFLKNLPLKYVDNCRGYNRHGQRLLAGGVG